MLKTIALIFLSFILTNKLFAKDSFSYGVGLSILSTPSYLGSNKQNITVVPFPYIELRSKYINIDRNKIYNEFYNSNNTKIEISLRGMLPVKSEGTLREGMKDLDALLELGPKLTYTLFKKKFMKINLEVPLRVAFSIGSDMDYQGFVGSLDLSYKNMVFNDFNIKFISGLTFSDKKINNYYYEINKEYVTTSRNEYHSKSGYSGFNNSISITKKDENFWYGGFIKYYYLDGAVFEKSALIETKSSYIYGLAFSYIF